MASRILRRHGWARADIAGLDLDHPGASVYRFDTDREMTTAEKLCASFLASLSPGLRVNASTLPPRFRLEFIVDLPREARAVFGAWSNLVQTVNRVYHGQSMAEAMLYEPPLDEDWFCRGLLQGLAQNIRVARAKAAKVGKKRSRKAKRNPLAVLICRKPDPVSIELGGNRGGGDSLITPPFGHPQTRQPAEDAAETHAEPAQASSQPAGDPRSFSLGFQAGILINPMEIV